MIAVFAFIGTYANISNGFWIYPTIFGVLLLVIGVYFIITGKTYSPKSYKAKSKSKSFDSLMADALSSNPSNQSQQSKTGYEHCPFCGARNPAGAKACARCGKTFDFDFD